MTSISFKRSYSLTEWMPALVLLAVLVLIFFTPEVLATTTTSGTATTAQGKVSDFFKNVSGVLKYVSVAIITIAVMIAGYQIAFAHKRISDVAPILVGALLIGGAAELAAMLLS